MKKHIFLIFVLLLSPLAGLSEITIESCVEKAIANYPAIAGYRLIDQTTTLDLADITTSWFPRIGLYAQATGQNAVAAFPSALTDMVALSGQKIKGLNKFQYQAGLEVSQTIYDGGATQRRKEVQRSKADLQSAALDVELYPVRRKVENIYFAILLTEAQIQRNQITHNLLRSNLDKLQAMWRNGTAMKADCDMLEAQMIAISQLITKAHYAVDGYRQVLSLYTGVDMTDETLIVPDIPALPSCESLRPELKLFDLQMTANDRAAQLSLTSLRPKVGAFLQAYYGYPGLNYFKSMISGNPSFNILAGVKFTWNFDSYYTRSSIKQRRDLQNRKIEVDKNTFLFGNTLQQVSQQRTIEALREVMKEDTRIVELRANVRKAAESQLANGIIDITALLTKIADENEAVLNAKCHELQLLQEIYILKYILNQ